MPDRVKAVKQTGMGRFPSREFAINAVWLQLALTAADLIAWTQTTLLNAGLAQAEPKKVRYQLWHTFQKQLRGHRGMWVLGRTRARVVLCCVASAITGDADRVASLDIPDREQIADAHMVSQSGHVRG